MKTKKPLHGHRYNITLFFNPEPFPAVFMKTYTDLFGEQYTDFFMDDAGKIFELSSVGQWEWLAVFGTNMKNHASPSGGREGEKKGFS